MLVSYGEHDLSMAAASSPAGWSLPWVGRSHQRRGCSRCRCLAAEPEVIFSPSSASGRKMQTGPSRPKRRPPMTIRVHVDDMNEDPEADDRCRRRSPTPQVWSAPWRLGARKPGRCAERRRRLDVSIGACSGMICHTFRSNK